MPQNGTDRELAEMAKIYSNGDSTREYSRLFQHRKKARAEGRGCSLGAMPKLAKKLFERELDRWAKLGWDAHLEGENPWWTWSEQFEGLLSPIAGCGDDEITIGNSLTVNVYILIGKMYREQRGKDKKLNKIMVPSNIFSSDLLAIKARLYEYGIPEDQVEKFIVYCHPGKHGLFNWDEVVAQIKKRKDIAIGWFEAVNYVSGQRAPLQKLSRALHAQGALFGVDLAHGLGNIELNLSMNGVDFSAGCSYKYENGGPGGVGILHVAKKHHKKGMIAGWWGNLKETRFGDSSKFKSAKGIRKYLMSNDQVFNSIGLLAHLKSYEKFDFNKMILPKHEMISDFLYESLSTIEHVTIITSKDWDERGCQITFTINSPHHDPHKLTKALRRMGCYVEPRFEYVRVAFVAYSSYEAVAIFTKHLRELVDGLPNHNF